MFINCQIKEKMEEERKGKTKMKDWEWEVAYIEENGETARRERRKREDGDKEARGPE